MTTLESHPEALSLEALTLTGEASSLIELGTTKTTLMKTMKIETTRHPTPKGVAGMGAETREERTALMMPEATALTLQTATPKLLRETQHLIETSRETPKGITSRNKEREHEMRKVMKPKK